MYYRAELTVVLGYLRRRGGKSRTFPGAWHRPSPYGYARRSAESVGLSSVFQHAFLNGLRPLAYVEEHLQYLVFIHSTQNFLGRDKIRYVHAGFYVTFPARTPRPCGNLTHE